MPDSQTRLDQTLAAFDAANAEDPNRETDQGESHPKEWLYGRRMTETLNVFCPDASEPLQLAARCQHIRRWESPRSDYPDGRAGYKKWRSQLALHHGRVAGQIMAEHGYDEETIRRVQDMLIKRNLKRDPEVQTLEDVICLVFLSHYLEDFAQKHNEEKLIDIIQKTWNKMSEKGHEAALKLPLSEPMGRLIHKALGA
ncbi:MULTISPECIES: DUF4202 domain-containing protein [Marinimicrobium]|jgi:hypothetical protein|uniref:Uncharacterized protein DUF4202 n=1 Tax=Marinimicrobium koreense TaxID=306545 RepID=A0A3N1NPA3_9GAMM|nr:MULTISPECIES: DUF4202 domain-containing protein [Marinimicrobium]MAN51602.1 hypothetical protein [Marinimicrobium sp.]ROQ20672.1 uncharacterized protein DUF4202 [Marinimicrobium koreense]|tara:strand:- start:64 stop:657 length:594 start_codon:yes stop_codon:yes gene_type:complete